MKTTVCSLLWQLWHNHDIGPRSDRARILLGLCTAVACVSTIFTVLADTASGCKWPKYWPSSICGEAPNGDCMRWVHNPAAISCDGPASYFVCFQYSVASTLVIYTGGNAPCDCAGEMTEVWRGGSPVTQAYNNDTQCYQ